MGGGYIKVFLALGAIVLIASSFNAQSKEGMTTEGQVGANEANIATLQRQMKEVNPEQLKVINERLTRVEESINDILDSQTNAANTVIDNSEELDGT